MNGLTWLHLSDWHQRGRDFDRTVVRDALLQDLRDRATGIDPGLAEVDFVVFSGDVAWSGQAGEYQAAREHLFEPVLGIVDRTPSRLFVVPGNHDLDRTVVETMLPLTLTRPLSSDAEVQAWLTDERKRARALEPFEAFAGFVAGFTGQKPPAYANTRVEFFGDLRVGLLGLNSAWMCGRRKEAGDVNDYGVLTVGEAQLHEALDTLRGADLRIAVLHHPFPWLAQFDQDRVQDRLKGLCHFILHGHEHQPGFNVIQGLGGECAVIPAGACYDRRVPGNPRHANAYNWVRLDPDTGRGVIFFRRWSEKRGAWIPDEDCCPGGRFEFRLPRELGNARPGAGTPRPQPATAPTSPGPSPRTPAVEAYLRRLADATSRLQLLGLGQGVQIELPIDQAYIPLRVVFTQGLRNEKQNHFDGAALRERDRVEENVLLGDLFKWTIRFGHRGALVLGDPGAGKTTGAQQFCWRALTDPDLPKSLGLPAGTVPVLLRLRELAPHHLAQGLAAFIRDRVAAPTLAPELAQPGPDLLARSGVLWVFDGLDEVVNENARVHVCGWIRQALEDRPDDFFLVTSRYQGYQGRVELGPAFCEFHVQPLDAAQVGGFVEHWYRTVCGKLLGAGEAAEAKATELTASLNSLLQEPEYRIGRLRELPANPLMLTILCVVHHQDRNLPRRRADLYARCVRVLVEHWRKAMWESQAIAGFDPEAAEAVLGSVAWRMHEQENRRTQTLAELEAAAERALADLAPAAGLGRDGGAFVRRMRDECGILSMWDAGQCGFLHLTFQEYLAGLHAAREGRVDDLVRHFGASWWREVILVAVAVGSRDFAERFFAALLRTDAVTREGFLVDQCLDEARFAVVEPFVVALHQPGAAPERLLDVLRRVRQLPNPELVAVCRDLAGAALPELAALAREVLERAGVRLERPVVEVLGAGLEVRVDSRTGMAFVRIPDGEFLMGSKDGDGDERPVHRVRISKPFLLGRYPVTNAEYGRFLEANPGAKQPSVWDDSRFNDPMQPVVGVSWHDATAFCEWAGYRLPTEAQWEYACRAGSQGRFSYGDDEALLGEYAWWSKNSGGRTQPVGQKKANAWGLHDVHGNVWEWCADWYGRYPEDLAIDPPGPPDGNSRVLRGGSWGNGIPAFLSCSYRSVDHPGGRYVRIGFRCVWLEGLAR